MNNTALRRAVEREMIAAKLEHNEIAELEELAHHLQRQLDKVLNRQSILLERRDDDPTYPEDDAVLSTL